MTKSKMNNKDEGNAKKENKNYSLAAIIISIISLAISCLFYKDNIRTGELIIHQPTGFCGSVPPFAQNFRHLLA